MQRRFSPRQLIYVLTNRICVQHWRGRFAEDEAKWRDRTEDTAYTMQWSDIGVQSVRVAERELARVQGWQLVDGFTDRHCSCTGLMDGRHFLPLAPNWLVRVARMVDEGPLRAAPWPNTTTSGSGGVR